MSCYLSILQNRSILWYNIPLFWKMGYKNDTRNSQLCIQIKMCYVNKTHLHRKIWRTRSSATLQHIFCEWYYSPMNIDSVSDIFGARRWWGICFEVEQSFLSCQYGISYVRPPCYRHGLSCGFSSWSSRQEVTSDKKSIYCDTEGYYPPINIFA